MEEIKEACGIKVGEYIRASGYYSFISKIKRIEFDNEAQLFWFVYDKKDFDTNITREWRINKPYIKNHSKNIIDLIEIGDYVNGWKVLGIVTTFDKPNEIGFKFLGFDNLLYDIDIKSIVTKEQFGNAEYRLED